MSLSRILRALIYWPCFAWVYVCLWIMFIPSVILHHLDPDDKRWWWWVLNEKLHD